MSPPSAANPTRRRNDVAMGKANMIDVATAVAESETAIQTMVAVRDKVIAAYEEILRMPI
jgi:flagellar hook-basal body complex protein FliE